MVPSVSPTVWPLPKINALASHRFARRRRGRRGRRFRALRFRRWRRGVARGPTRREAADPAATTDAPSDRSRLKAKSYHYQYVFALNAAHSDRNVRNQTLAHALEWVGRGYPVAQARD